MVLRSFQVYTARFPIKVYWTLGSNLLSLLTSLPVLSHTRQFSGQLVPCKQWGSYKLLSAWPQELSTSSETTSTMGVPPPFLLLFGTKYVRIINVLAAKNLGIHYTSLSFVSPTRKVWCLHSESLGPDASSALLVHPHPFSELHRVLVCSPVKWI